MDGFIPPAKEEIQKYEREAPRYTPVVHAQRLSRYTKRDDGRYELIKGSAANEAVILCAGDMLCEGKLYKFHYFGGNFNFHDVFSFVRPILQKADLTIGNLETTICSTSPYTGEQYKVDGKYHCNAPVEFLDAVAQAGFDFLALANNHNLDSGYQGVLETLYHIDKRMMMHTGLFRPEEEKRYCVVDVNGIRIGLLAYSTWYNRNQNRFTAQGRQLLNEYDPKKAAADIQAARASGAEFVLVYMHWGVDAEYKSTPSKSMRRMAQEVADGGADYIIGSHTHSLQPYETVTSSSGKKVPCIFSLGNFVTSEISSISRETGMLEIRLKKGKNEVHVTRERFIPCYIPDSSCGIGYPIVPEMYQMDSSSVKAQIEQGCSHARSVVGLPSLSCLLTKKSICRILDLPVPDEPDVAYTKLSFPFNAEKGGVAIISRITSDPSYTTPESDYEELARAAIQRGAKLLLAPKQISDYPVFLVKNPFDAYCRITAAIRRMFSPKTVSITGSIGKTTATEMVYSVMNSRYNTHRNTGSANNVRYAGGVIQNLKPEHEVYVQETMEGPPYGAASTIAQMVQPQAAIVTVVGTSHMEAFGSQERILESCLGVQNGMPEDGLLILNADDSLQWGARSKCSRRVLYYGIKNERADYRAVNIRGKDLALCFDILHGGECTPVQIHCFGRHNVLNALAAFAAGRWAGMSSGEAAAGLDKYRTTGIRQNLVEYAGFRLFLDCYNSALESVQSALDAFSEIPVSASGRRIAVLADIKEAGAEENEIHRQMGKVVLGSCVDMLVCYGERSSLTAEVVRTESQLPVYHTNDPKQLISFLRESITTNDVTLFKGSHSMALEQIVDQVWGTWFHEEFEQYDFKTRIISDANLKYQVYTDHVTVINKVSSAADVIIPDFIDGLPVTSIGKSVFSGSKFTRSVVLPNHLVNIRYCAFYKANCIRMIDIPASVRIIDASAFSTCENLEQVTIADGCTHIGRRAFGNCRKLRSITIPASVNQIEDEVFLNCDNLTIFGVRGSYAENYARRYKIRFTPLPPGRGKTRMQPRVDPNIFCALMDADSGKVLFEQNGTSRTMIASLAKIMLAYRQIKLIETARTPWKWGDRYTCQEEVTYRYLAGTTVKSNSTVRGEQDGVMQYLSPGEEMSMESLLYGAMVLSGNDAASALAVALDGSEEAYLRNVNAQMHTAPFNLSECTQFGRTYGRECYSTALDIAQMLRTILADKDAAPKFWTVCGAANTVGKVDITLTDGSVEHITKPNTHQFISGAYRSRLEDAIGRTVKICGKTGTFENYYLATAVEAGGKTLIAVVLRAKTQRIRDDSTLAILSWGFND